MSCLAKPTVGHRLATTESARVVVSWLVKGEVRLVLGVSRVGVVHVLILVTSLSEVWGVLAGVLVS